jgi:hypothetical protein
MNSKSCFSRDRLRRRTDVHSRIISIGILAGLLGTTLLPGWQRAEATDAPPWLHVLSSAPLPQHDDKTNAVLLYSEKILSVQANGQVKEIERAAYKILRPDGRHLGKLHFYSDSENRITRIHGWCIPAEGKDYEVKDKDVTLMGVGGPETGVLYADDKVETMEIPAPDPGNIIGYEVEHEGRPYVFQDEWFFQHTLPVADARYTLELPGGWEYKAVWVNHPEVAPTSVGNNSWQWQVKNLPEIKEEQYMPPWKGVAGLMIVSLIPPGGGNRGFLTWSEMGSWYTGLVQGRRDPSPELKQKVAELTAQTKTALSQMLAIAQFMQNDIRYVEIALGIGGVQPHPARDVFSNRYGDCKDKVTLMSAMLKEVGVDSYYVVIHTRRGGVTASVPPHLGAFNHMIIAIRVPDRLSDARLIATMQHPKLGKLLIFDPTDEVTPFGSLRGELQGSYGLLIAPGGGELLQMPSLPPVNSGWRRTAKLTLDSQGVLKGEVYDERVGDAALWQREELRNVEKGSDRIKPLERLMAGSLSNFQITKATVSNLHDSGSPFIYQWSFVALDYAKSAGNLLLVRPRVLGEESSSILENKEPRRYPVEFWGTRHDVDVFEIALPTGYQVDELPPPTDLEYSFGSYHSKSVVEGNVLRYTRTLEIKQLSVPLDQMDDLKKFYRAIASDERNTAVLKPVS